MGTNYYLHRSACSECGRGDEPLHIGKSSGGWVFSLHVTDEIPDLAAWICEWDNGEIRDEYGQTVGREAMLGVILLRKGRDWERRTWSRQYGSEGAFHNVNGSARGPRNLLRSLRDPDPPQGFTYQHVTGEFA